MVTSIDDEGNWFIKIVSSTVTIIRLVLLVKRRYFLQKERSRIIGESTIGATIAIIQEFKPKVWIIENPQTSLTWKFQKYHWDFYGNENLAYYSAYDNNFSKKPTIFKSNIKLNLKTDRVIGNNAHMAKGSYAQRSAIPSLLIEDILEQVLSLWY